MTCRLSPLELDALFHHLSNTRVSSTRGKHHPLARRKRSLFTDAPLFHFFTQTSCIFLSPHSITPQYLLDNRLCDYSCSRHTHSGVFRNDSATREKTFYTMILYRLFILSSLRSTNSKIIESLLIFPGKSGPFLWVNLEQENFSCKRAASIMYHQDVHAIGQVSY